MTEIGFARAAPTPPSLAAILILIAEQEAEVYVPHDGERDCTSAYPDSLQFWCPRCLARLALAALQRE